MPGLLGLVSVNGERINPALMHAMRDAIRCQDWYQIDDYISLQGTVAVSRVHLGIINREKQPYVARNGKVKVFLHGEIYDDEGLAPHALDLIYQLYEKKGLDFALSLNGSFVIVILDEEKDITLVATDRVATKPLFYYYDGRTVYFGPEMKSFFLSPTFDRKLYMPGLVDFLTNGQFTREHTLIENLEAVDSGTVLKITRGGVTRHKYWTHPYKYGFSLNGQELSQADYQEKLDEVLSKAVRRRLNTDHQYGVLLSGGWDSRGILGYYLQARSTRGLHTISWGREEDIENSDCAIAKRLAHKLGIDHHFCKLTAQEVLDNLYDFVKLGEGLTWFPESYQVFHRIREQGINVVLRGDEWLGSQAPLVHDEHTMFRKLSLMALPSIREYQRILKPHYYQMFCDIDNQTRQYVSSTCSATNIRDRKDFFYVNILLKHYLNPLNYVKNFAIESFTPLLDHDVIDFVSTLPIKYRLHKYLYRRVVAHKFPNLFEEIAQRDNLIDWADSFKSSQEIQRLLYWELIEEEGIFTEFVNMNRLKRELDAFFAPKAPASVKQTMSMRALKLLQKSPAAYDLAHHCTYLVKKRTGRVRDTLPISHLLIRLLILKVWGKVFLNYPVQNSA
jgi:asparagine synthetase B (glutamine-hydrolysing)